MFHMFFVSLETPCPPSSVLPHIPSPGCSRLLSGSCLARHLIFCEEMISKHVSSRLLPDMLVICSSWLSLGTLQRHCIVLCQSRGSMALPVQRCAEATIRTSHRRKKASRYHRLSPGWHAHESIA